MQTSEITTDPVEVRMDFLHWSPVIAGALVASAFSLVPHHHPMQQIGALFRRGRAVQRVFHFDERHTLKSCLAVAFLQRIDWAVV